MRVNTWNQEEFTGANQQLHRDRGDFFSATGFRQSPDAGRLIRFETWGDFIAYPDGFEDLTGITFDQTNNRIILIGKRTSDSHLASAYVDLTPSTHGPYELVADTLELGGKPKQNLRYWGGYLWLITDDENVYRGTDYTTTLSSFYTGGDAWILISVADRMFMVTEGGDVYRLNDDNTAFELLYDAILGHRPAFATPYHGHLLVVNRSSDGTLHILQIHTRSPSSIREITSLPTQAGRYSKWPLPAELHVNPVALFQDSIHGCSPPYGEHFRLFTYRFDGSDILQTTELHIPFEHTGLGPQTWGLTAFRNDLLLYLYRNEHQDIYIQMGEHFTPAANSTYDIPSITPPYGDIYTAGGQLIMVIKQDTTEGLVFLDEFGSSVFTTSWLDFGHPTIEKRVSKIAATVSDAIEDFEVKLEYRTEDTGWTELTEQDNARVVANTLYVISHLIQIRVTFTDNTDDGDQDVELLDVGVTYSYGLD